jgi:hypothetical protein
MSTLRDFAREHGLTLHIDRVSGRPDLASRWGDDARHWKFRIVSGNGRGHVRGYYSQGPACTKPPTLEEILGCLADDAAAYENAGSFAGWAAEYGYNSDSISALAVYHTVRDESQALADMLGPDAYDALLWEVDRG